MKERWDWSPPSRFGEFTTVLLSGITTNHVGRFPVLFHGMMVAAFLFGLVSLTRSIFALAALNFLFGIASGAILASSLTVIADRSSADERGLEMGRFDAMNLAGWLGGFAFGIGILGFIKNHRLSISAFRTVLYLGALVLLAGLLLAWFLARVVARASIRCKDSRSSRYFGMRSVGASSSSRSRGWWSTC